MASRKKGRANGSEPGRLDRLERGFSRLETVQRDTNTRLGRIERVLETSSKLFEFMHERLEKLEEGQQAVVAGQKDLVEGQKDLVEGQKLIVDRLDRLVAASVRDRTEQVERIARLEQRVDTIERRKPSE